MVQRYQALSAKKWYVRDNPKATGYTMDDLRGMNVKTLAKNMVGYTASIPGTRASKAQLRRAILTMVRVSGCTIKQSLHHTAHHYTYIHTPM